MITSRVWEFENEIKFAGSCFYSPEKDFAGKRIQNIENVNVPLSHVFLTVFPQEGKTYAIISWLKKDGLLFQSYGSSLDKLKNNERQNFISFSNSHTLLMRESKHLFWIELSNSFLSNKKSLIANSKPN